MFKRITYIKILNFGGNKSEMELARVLLENAPEFSKMEIVMELSLPRSERKVLKMTEILMLKSELQMLTYTVFRINHLCSHRGILSLPFEFKHLLYKTQGCRAHPYSPKDKLSQGCRATHTY